MEGEIEVMVARVSDVAVLEGAVAFGLLDVLGLLMFVNTGLSTPTQNVLRVWTNVALKRTLACDAGATHKAEM